MNMNRVELFKKAKVAVADLLREFPETHAAVSIDVQLDYLIALETGAETNRSRLEDIIIGILTVREIEPRSEAVAELLYKVSGEVRKMIYE